MSASVSGAMPRHIGIIMDGNGRWAKRRLLPRKAGHSAGSRKFQDIARYCNKIGIECLTVYAFSTENWSRPKEEVDALMGIFRDYLKDAKNFVDENIKVRFIGDRSVLEEDLQALMKDAEDASAEATGLMLNIAINYGGHDEIVTAVNKVLESDKDIGRITSADIERNLYTSDQPPVDLIIRPSGECRLSNFLVWQSAYAELWFSDVLWPDFSTEDLDRAISDFGRRQRRFGGVKE
ncbi:MAG: di-trans,poly-cis-decaprenylcistransferase [Clostridia bacterium]|nr:di-trans,poly-cis-decaprenylcistransferase [Clostridia bacterium]